MTASTESGRVPDFFIVGHPKSGTTALYEMLRSHPQIFMPDLKEPRFFATDLRPRFQPREAAGAPRQALPETLEEYLSLFEGARPEQRVGESSPSYLRSGVAAGLIAQAQPAARIVAILREPASFLRSLHLELVQNHVEREQDLRRALADEDLGSSSPLPRYSDRVRYVEQLERYHAAFPPEQVLVLIYDDFRSDNEGTVRRVLRFLDVDEAAPVALVEANPTVHVRSVRLDRMVRAAYAGQGPVSRRAKAAVKTLTPARLHGDAFRSLRRRVVYGAPRPPDDAFMLELRRRFKDEVVALGEYLDRDLVGLWGYDDID
ncbi:MAG TPA: sulfotransferase, partial [Solirubrobacteraceae bacterium]|nr:sulfotransferase [Solirubrobacteraceae bacterium]